MPESHALLPRVVADYLTIRSRGGTLQERSHGYELEPRTLSTHNFIYPQIGNVVWEIEGQPIEAQAGDLLCVPRGKPHRGWSTTQKVRIVSLHVVPILPGGQDGFELAGPPPLLKSVAGTELGRWVENAGHYLTGNGPTPQGRKLLPGFAHLVSHGYLLMAQERGLLEPCTLDPVIQEVLTYIHAEIDQPMDLAGITRRSGYTPQYLNRLFVRTLGVTPLKIRQRIRLEQAATWLRETNWTAAAIAERLAFTDPAHFSRAFKQHYGQSPAAYRETLAD